MVKALITLFSVFGFPKAIEADQGLNFMSRIFAQVLKHLTISHDHLSAYCPESQGALDRFYQTLKLMLRAFCLEIKTWLMEFI